MFLIFGGLPGVGKTTIARQVAKVLSAVYATASISNWVRAYNEENRLTPRPSGYRKSVLTGAELEQLSELLEKNVDLTLAEIKEHFGVQCSLVVIHKILIKLGFV